MFYSLFYCYLFIQIKDDTLDLITAECVAPPYRTFVGSFPLFMLTIRFIISQIQYYTKYLIDIFHFICPSKHLRKKCDEAITQYNKTWLSLSVSVSICPLYISCHFFLSSFRLWFQRTMQKKEHKFLFFF